MPSFQQDVSLHFTFRSWACSVSVWAFRPVNASKSYARRAKMAGMMPQALRRTAGRARKELRGLKRVEIAILGMSGGQKAFLEHVSLLGTCVQRGSHCTIN